MKRKWKLLRYDRVGIGVTVGNMGMQYTGIKDSLTIFQEPASKAFRKPM